MRPLRSISTESLSTSLGAWGRARDGGVAVTVAVMTAVLVGVLALSIDLGRLYNASTERNNAADAAAVAAATQLDGKSNACHRAIDAAIKADLANQETFTSNRTGTDVYISPVGSTGDPGSPTANPNIRFLSDLIKDNSGNVIGTYITDPSNCDANAHYVEVTMDLVAAGQEAEVDYYFAGIIGALTQSFPRGYAVAHSGEVFCAKVPLFMCPLTGDPTDTNAAAQFWEEIKAYEHTGKGVFLKHENNSDQYLPGDFGFLRLANSGAFELGEQLGMANPPPNCVGAGEVSTEPGANESAAKAFNSRFDIFHNGSMADRSSPQWQPSANATKGYVRAAAQQCDVSTGGYYLDPAKAMGFPRDAGHINGTCTGRMCDGVWDVNSYLQMALSDPTVTEDRLLNDPTLNGGYNVDIPWEFAGDGKVSRYEMYLWQMDRRMRFYPNCDQKLASQGLQSYLPDYDVGANWNSLGPGANQRISGSALPSGPGYQDDLDVREYGGGRNSATGSPVPQCGTIGDLPPPWWADPNSSDYRPECSYEDRRVLDILLVNCAALPKATGHFNVPQSTILGSVKVFVVSPWKFSKASGGQHDLYIEIIGPGDEGGFGEFSKRHWVELKESRKSRDAAN